MTAAFIAVLALAPTNTAALIAALLLFIVAGATDALDGYLARRWNAISVFGRIADPLADKLLILGAFVMLAGADFPRSPIEPWMITVILARELLVTTLRGALEGKGVDFSAGNAGKLKMILQWLLLTAVLIDLFIASTDDLGQDPPRWGTALALITVAFTALSAVPYVQRAIRATRPS